MRRQAATRSKLAATSSEAYGETSEEVTRCWMGNCFVGGRDFFLDWVISTLCWSFLLACFVWGHLWAVGFPSVPLQKHTQRGLS